MCTHLTKSLHLSNTCDTTFKLNKSSWREGGHKKGKGSRYMLPPPPPDYSRFVNTDKIFIFWIKKLSLSYKKYAMTCVCTYWYNHSYSVFSLTWPASMQIYWNKRKRLRKKRVQLPQDWFGTQTRPPFHCFGTQTWPPWRHVKTHNKKNKGKIMNVS